MAITKIKTIKNTVNKAINYITDPSKTDGCLLVTGFNCEKNTAHLEFNMTNILAKQVKGDYGKEQGKNNVAYHLIQSFAKYDKLTPEQAHEIGIKLADEFLQGKHEYIIATHIDKGHIHNHIIFNSTSFYDYKKYKTEPYKTVEKIRTISDKLCKERGLYVNIEKAGKGKSRYEWETEKAGISWKTQIKDNIDKALLKAKDYNDFVALLNKAKIEVKEGKHIAFKLEGQERFVRGKTIGNKYTREGILQTIKRRDTTIERSKDENEKRYGGNFKNTRKEHFGYDKGVVYKARKQQIAATKELALALLLIRREDIKYNADFGIKIEELKEQSRQIKTNIKTLNNKNSQYKDAAKYLVAYNKYLPFKTEYESLSKFRKSAYYKKNESELLACEFAIKNLNKLGLNTNIHMDKVIELVKSQTRQVSELTDKFKQNEQRINEIMKASVIVNNVICKGQEQTEQKEKERTKEKVR